MKQKLISLVLLVGSIVAGSSLAVQVDLIGGLSGNDNFNRLYSDSEFMIFMLPRGAAGTTASHFQVRFDLPEGTGFQKILPLYSSSLWDCSATAIGASNVVCNRPAGALPLGSHLMLQVDTTTVPAGTATEFRAYLEDLNDPFPVAPACVGDSSTTGCTSLSTPIRRSALRFSKWRNGIDGSTRIDAMSTAAPFEVRSFFQVDGYRQIHVTYDVYGGESYDYRGAPIELEITLPPELETNPGTSGWSSAQPWGTQTCVSSTDVDHEVILCQISSPSVFYDDDIANIVGWVKVKSGASITGPVAIYTAIGNGYTPLPTDCANPQVLQTNEQCARLMVTVLTPPDLRFTQITPSPAVFAPGRDGEIRLDYKNLGTSRYTQHLGVKIKLPVGFEYRGIEHGTEIAGCTVSGTVATGQVVDCYAPSPPGFYFEGLAEGWINIQGWLDPQLTEVPGFLNVVSAIGLANNNTLLAGCISNPTQTHCALKPISVSTCAYAHSGAEGIFCDGFEEWIPGM